MADEKPNGGAPTVAHIIANAVLVCSCPSKTVIVLNLMGGTIICPACKRNWYSPKMVYELDRVTKVLHIECLTEEVPTIDVYDSLSSAALMGRKMPGGN